MSEVIKIFTEAEAERLTMRLKMSVESVENSLAKYRDLLAEAHNSNAWQVLGFGSWKAYVDSLFDGPVIHFEPQERVELVAFLSERGMSTRAIAPAVNASQRTVSNDLSKIAHQKADANEAPLELSVKGLDGKTYQRKPAPVTPRRRSLPDTALDAATGALTAVERLESIVKDDRFASNIGAITELVAARADRIADGITMFRRSMSVGRVAALEEMRRGDLGAQIAVSVVGDLIDVQSITREQAAAAIEHIKPVMTTLRERAES